MSRHANGKAMNPTERGMLSETPKTSSRPSSSAVTITVTTTSSLASSKLPKE